MGAINERGRLMHEGKGIMHIPIAGRVSLTQWDVREFQKAKAAIRVAADILLERLSIDSHDLEHVYLTGSFGGQLNIEAALALGVVPEVDRGRIELFPNEADLGAAMFLQSGGFAMGEELAQRANHVELDLDPAFNTRFIEVMGLQTADRNNAHVSVKSRAQDCVFCRWAIHRKSIHLPKVNNEGEDQR